MGIVGITDKVAQIYDSMQAGARSASHSVVGLVLKISTAFVVSLTLAMIGQELFNYGTLSFVFIMLVGLFALIRVMSAWSVGVVLVFDLVCLLVALLLRMYILLAP